MESHRHDMQAFDDALVKGIRNAISQMEGTPILVGHSLAGTSLLRYLESHPAKAAAILNPWTGPSITQSQIASLLHHPRLINRPSLDPSTTFSLYQHYLQSPPLQESVDATGFPMLTLSHVSDPFGREVDAFVERYGGELWMEEEEDVRGKGDGFAAHLGWNDAWLGQSLLSWLQDI
ncbi:hypothetical protein HDU97_009679 [Phlyctochytrium planicorne]|nr:hypothetical protein HDU97_009679 [Phlyctochytrium planicorne]